MLSTATILKVWDLLNNGNRLETHLFFVLHRL